GLVVRSVASSEPIELAELFSKKRMPVETLDGDWDAPVFHGYGPRRFQQFRHEDYSSFVYDDPAGGHGDNSKPFLTVAAAQAPPPTDVTAEAKFHLWADEQEARANPVPFTRYAATRVWDGARIARQARWETNLRRIASPWLLKLKGNQDVPADLTLLTNDLLTRRLVFSHLESIVLSEWFRSRDLERQIEILRSSPGPTLSQHDVIAAASYLEAAGVPLENRAFALFESVNAHTRLGFAAEAETLARVVVNLLPNGHELRRAALDALAINLLDQGKAAEARSVWQDLAGSWDRARQPYPRLVALKNVARAELALGNRGAFERTVSEMVEGAKQLSTEEQFGAWLNLAGLYAQAGELRLCHQTLGDAASVAAPDQLLLTTSLLAMLGPRREGESISPNEWRSAIQRVADLRDRHR
ncbi:MAG TPA: hypothetical protein VGB18_08920, partial [Candidatus Thermoplasmatota archaeon]